MATTINITNSGSGAYLIDNVSNGTIQLVRGNTYNLVITATGHPFWIQTVPGGHSSSNIYNSGITNNGTESGTIIFVVPNDAPDTLYYACQFHSSMQGTITITGAPVPSITNFTIANQTYSIGGTFILTPPTSDSPGEFSYESSQPNIASVSGTTISILQAGPVTITATQAETVNYASGSITASFTINKAIPIITNFTIANQTYSSGGTFTLTPPTSDDSPGEFSYTSSQPNIASVSGTTVSILQAGPVTITATQAETVNYASGSITASFTINKAIPIITNFTIANQTYSSGGTFTLTPLTPPTSNSTGAFSYTSYPPNIVSVSGTTVTMLQAGTVTITATQAETTNYASGSITASFTININIIPYNLLSELYANKSLIYLSDCTPLYTTLGAPARITGVIFTPLQNSVRLEWSPPPNSNNVIVDSYIIRYKLYGAPLTQTLGELVSFFPAIIVAGLANGNSYDFWVVAKNRFGESPHSPTVTVAPGAPPSSCQFVRRAYHTTISGDDDYSVKPQKVGLEFTPPIIQNGASPLVFTIKYTRIVGGGSTDTSYVILDSVQPNTQIMRDASGNLAIKTTGAKGNYIRKDIAIPTTVGGITSGEYRFEVFTTNIYGISAAPDISFIVQLYSITDSAGPPSVPRFTAPSFAYYSIPANAGVVAVDASDSSIRFRWKQYRGTDGTGSTGADAYVGWSYRIQYTPNTAKFPEYTRAYDRVSSGAGTADFEYSIDISRNVVNGRRYYVRYCVINAAGDTSEYTQITDTNLALTSGVPGRLPSPPPIFRASTDDRLVRLYFNWTESGKPPSLDETGGLPILDYRIERYIVSRDGGIFTISSTPNAIFENVPGPFYEDQFEIRFNGVEYYYRVFSRNAFGHSVLYTSVSAIPTRPSDIVWGVTSAVDSGQITLEWNQPNELDQETPIVQYYIEYRKYDIFSVPAIPPENIVGEISNTNTISNTIQDMNSILVNDTLWGRLTTTVVSKFTNSTNLSYTIRDLINRQPYVFRVAAVTQDRVRRKLIGLLNVIGENSPYLPRPTIIGKVPTRMTNVEYVNGDGSVAIKWSNADVNNNTERIIRYIVDYRIALSGSAYSQQTFEYANSIVFNDGSSSISFIVYVTGLNNNVPSSVDTSNNSYEMVIYAENSVGYTNLTDRIDLHEDLIFTDVYEGLLLPRIVRPRTIPSAIAELRTTSV